ncbi:MAG: flavodoxin domain-containing protein [Candidatus Bathyarchaeota archaeon]|nr:MAG: flavodoxin domain-containing protein [Candidatus Bathyarchaeota archaeon]
MTKALIVYGTRYGATADTSEVIADVLRKEGLEVRVVNVKEEKVQNISEYGLIVVGSGIRMGSWTKEPEEFLRKFQQELAKKKMALFVCCGSTHPVTEEEEKTRAIEDARRNYLAEKAAKHNLNPVALGLFGGIYNFNKMSWIFRKTLSVVRSKLEEAGFKEKEDGVYDIRDLNTIRRWAKKVAKMVGSQP